MPAVESVSGPLEAEELGVTLIHEHLRARADDVPRQFPRLYDHEAELRSAVEVARGVMEQGVKTVCDPAVMGLGRDVRLMRKVAEETGLQVIAATGIYTYKELPQHFRNRDVDYLAEVLMRDIEEGIQGTDVKAAFLKCAVDEPGITDDVEKVVRACARASKETGRPIMAHSHPATRRGLEEMDVFDDEGVDPAKVQIAHTGDTDDLDYIEELLRRGPLIGMDRYGLDIILPTDKRNATVAALLERGHAARMFLSTDAAGAFDWFPDEMVQQFAPKWKSTLIFDEIVPGLREAGMTDEQLETMLVENPRRWLGGD